MYLKIFFLLIIFLLLINSCDYSPTDTYYKEIAVPQPNIDFVILDENSLNALRGIAHISYSSLLDDKELIGIEAYIDGHLVETSGSISGVLDIDTRNFTDGEYILKLQMMVTTESGSLADLTGTEAFILTKEYNILIYNAPITPPEITDMFIENNALHIRWEKYEGPAFQKYILAHSLDSIRIIFDQDSVECIDYAYAGGYASRILITVVAGKSFQSSRQSFNSPDVEFTSATLVDDNKIKLEWERSIFDSAFSYYKIYLGHYDDPDAYEMITDINTTSFTDTNPVFGGSPEYGILTIPKIDLETLAYPNSITAPAIGQECVYSVGDFLDYVPAMSSYFVYHGKKLWVYNQSFNLINSAQYAFNSNYEVYSADISSDGELLYLVKDYVNTDVAKINSTTLQIEQTYNLNDIAGYDIGYVYAISVSDNNLLLVAATEYQVEKKSYVFDMNTGTLVAALPIYGNGISYKVKFSNDGKYFQTQGELYMLNNSTPVPIGNVSDESLFLENSEYLVDFVTATYKTVQIIKCADLSVQKEYTWPNTLYNGATLGVDKADDYIGVEAYSRGYYYIMDMQNEEIKKRIPIRDYFYTYQNRAIFGNGRALHVTF